MMQLSYEEYKEILKRVEKEVEKEMLPFKILGAIVAFIAVLSVCIEIGQVILKII